MYNYSEGFEKYGDSAKAVCWSAKGQKERFDELVKIGNLNNTEILDLGCGLGHLYKYLINRKTKGFKYAGIDYTQVFIDQAKDNYPKAGWYVKDLRDLYLPAERYDYAFMSGAISEDGFNWEAVKGVIGLAYRSTRRGVAFNFLSNRAEFKDKELRYYCPVRMLSYCLTLTKQVIMKTHYRTADTVVYLYKHG